ncbi:hypothetical protein Q7P37_010909 [Cladosporium fusiforme]
MDKAQDISRIDAFSAKISEDCSKVDAALSQSGIPGGGPDWPCVAVIDATHELKRLTIEVAVLRFIYRFKHCYKVPVHGEISYGGLNKLAGIQASTLR